MGNYFRKFGLAIVSLLLITSLFVTAHIQAAANYNSVISTDGPISYWRLGETSGTTVQDVNNLNNGTYFSNPFLGQSGAIIGDTNTASSFNGTSSYASIPYKAALNSTPFSIEAWAYPTGGTDYRAVVASRFYPKGWVIYAQSTSAGNNWSFWLNSGTAMKAINGPAVQLNTWTHLVGTFDGTTAKLYVNGTQVASSAVTNYGANTTSAMTIGRAEPTQNFFFPGKIDEVAYYNKVLTAAQISNHYQTGIGGTLVTPTPTVTSTPTPSATPSATPTASPSATPTSTPTGTPSNTFNRGIVTVTLDDSWISHYTNAYPTLQANGLKATFYTITSWLNTGSDVMTSSNIQTLHQNGHEIGSHSVTHPHMKNLTVRKMDSELLDSQIFLQNLIESPVTNFATPYGEYNNTVLTEIKKYYGSHRTSDFGYNTKTNLNTNKLLVQYSYVTTTPTQIQAYVDQAKASKSWLILVYHQIDNSGDQYSTSPTNFATEMQNLKNSGVAVLTVQQALNEILPQVGQ